MVPSARTEAQSLRTTEETIQPNNKAPRRIHIIWFFCFFCDDGTCNKTPQKGREAVGLDPGGYFLILPVFSVTPFKIDQNKNQNRSTNKVQNLGNERRYIYKDLRQDSGIFRIRDTRRNVLPKLIDLYGDAMLVLTWMSSNMAEGNQQKHLLPSFATEA